MNKMSVRKIVALLLIGACLTKLQYCSKSNSSYCSKNTLERKIQVGLVTISLLWVFQQDKRIFLGQRMYSAIIILLLLAGDVETCPGSGCKCYCGKNIKLEHSTGICIACTEKCHIRCLVNKLQYGGERLFCRRCVLNTLPQKKDNDAETAVVVYKELCDFLKTRGLKIFHQNVNVLFRKKLLLRHYL